MARRFVFPLQTVLELRALREQQQRRRFAQALAALAHIERRIAELRRRRRSEQRSLAEDQWAGRGDAGSWLRRRGWIAQLAQQITTLEAQRTQAAEAVEQQRRIWQQKRNELRALQRLRERRYASWRKDRLKHEQGELDELAQQLHSRRRRRCATVSPTVQR